MGESGGTGQTAIARTERRFYFSWRFWVLLVGLLLVGAIAGFVSAALADDHILRGVSVGGIEIGGLRFGEAESLLRAQSMSRSRPTLHLTSAYRSWNGAPAEMGIELDYKESVAQAMLVGRRGDLRARFRERRRVSRSGAVLPLSFRIDQGLWDSYCRMLEAELNHDPVQTVVEVGAAGSLTISTGTDGQRLDRAALLRMIQRNYLKAGYGISLELPLVLIQPKISADDLEEWPLDQVLGVYTTKFNAEDRSRSSNLRLAAKALDGQVVEPGASFSFNKNVGPRAPEKGYLEAGVISKSRLVLGVGGGVCQVSGTLFNAVLLANLQIVKRTSHTIPSSYLPLGRDATVVYESLDLVFANNLGRPVVITAAVSGSRLTIAVVGHWEVRPQIKVEVIEKKSIPFETIVQNDPGLAAGVQAVMQEGRSGHKIELWRVISWPDGRVEREMIGESNYPPQTKVVKRGIGSPRFGNLKPPAPAASPAVPAQEGNR